MAHSCITINVQSKNRYKIQKSNFKKYIPLINNELLLQKIFKKTIGISLAPVGFSHLRVAQQFE